MSQRTEKISGWVVGLVVAGALAFGLSVAVVTPASALTCQNDGWNFVGQQPDEVTCQNVCYSIHGGDVVGHWNPTTGCCSCLY